MHQPFRSAVLAAAIALPIIDGLSGCKADENLGNSPLPATPLDAGTDAAEGPLGLRTFVTDATFTGDLATAGGAGSGLASADAICQSAADAARLGGTFMAYLSSGATNAVDRIVDDGPFYLVDGKTLAYTSKGSIGAGSSVEITGESGKKVYDITVGRNEWGELQGSSSTASFWTGSLANGRASGNDCSQWTSGELFTDGSQATQYGASQIDLACENKFHLLCLEQKSAKEPIAKKRVFVTSKMFEPSFASGGRSAFEGVDAHCNAAAKDAGLDGAWVGWLSGRDKAGKIVRARDRVSDAIYTLMDGRSAFASKKDLDGVPTNPIDMNEFGAKITRSEVWTGTLRGGAPASNNCDGWTNSTRAFYGLQGIAASAEAIEFWTGPEVESGITDACSDVARLYCFEK